MEVKVSPDRRIYCLGSERCSQDAFSDSTKIQRELIYYFKSHLYFNSSHLFPKNREFMVTSEVCKVVQRPIMAVFFESALVRSHRVLNFLMYSI